MYLPSNTDTERQINKILLKCCSRNAKHSPPCCWWNDVPYLQFWYCIYPYAAHLKCPKQMNESANHEKTRLLANYFHSSKEESQRPDEIGNSLVPSIYHLFITFCTILQDKHREVLLWHLWGGQNTKSHSLLLWCPQIVLLEDTLVH